MCSLWTTLQSLSFYRPKQKLFFRFLNSNSHTSQRLWPSHFGLLILMVVTESLASRGKFYGHTMLSRLCANIFLLTFIQPPNSPLPHS
ncbi:unnamed protein product [Ixodes persulcatus]